MLKHVLDNVVVWKQPLEELGTYSARHYKKTVRDALAMDYINLDMMVTNSSPCLKWGPMAYCGRVSFPEGVAVECYEGWHKDGVLLNVIHGPCKDHDIWNFHHRAKSFHVRRA